MFARPSQVFHFIYVYTCKAGVRVDFNVLVLCFSYHTTASLFSMHDYTNKKIVVAAKYILILNST